MFENTNEAEATPKIKIAYQGRPGSNSEKAARLFAVKPPIVENGTEDDNDAIDIDSYVEFVPCVSSRGVVEALKSGKADYGVMAIRNSHGGSVNETTEALKEHGDDICRISQENMPIHHCLFVKDDKVTKADIYNVASHPQAISQCFVNIRVLLEGQRFSVLTKADTALAAEELAKAGFLRDMAVICSKEAGERNGLHMMFENIEDHKDNVTTFGLYARSPALNFAGENQKTHLNKHHFVI